MKGDKAKKDTDNSERDMKKTIRNKMVGIEILKLLQALLLLDLNHLFKGKCVEEDFILHLLYLGFDMMENPTHIKDIALRDNIFAMM